MSIVVRGMTKIEDDRWAGMLGRNIKRVLERQGKSQRDIAKEVGITEASLSRYINNVRVPRATVLQKIADALGVTTDQLLQEEETNYDRIRIRIQKYNYTQMLEETVSMLKEKEDKKEFLEYAKKEADKRLKRLKAVIE